jgi:hypothetical protein
MFRCETSIARNKNYSPVNRHVSKIMHAKGRRGRGKKREPNRKLALLSYLPSNWLRAGRPEFWDSIPGAGGEFSLHTASRLVLRPAQPPIQRVPGALSLVVKRPEIEANHSPPSSAEVNNAWSCTSTPQYVFMAWYVVEHRDDFTFYLYLLFTVIFISYQVTAIIKHALSYNIPPREALKYITEILQACKIRFYPIGGGATGCCRGHNGTQTVLLQNQFQGNVLTNTRSK